MALTENLRARIEGIEMGWDSLKALALAAVENAEKAEAECQRLRDGWAADECQLREAEIGGRQAQIDREHLEGVIAGLKAELAALRGGEGDDDA